MTREKPIPVHHYRVSISFLIGVISLVVVGGLVSCGADKFAGKEIPPEQVRLVDFTINKFSSRGFSYSARIENNSDRHLGEVEMHIQAFSGPDRTERIINVYSQLDRISVPPGGILSTSSLTFFRESKDANEDLYWQASIELARAREESDATPKRIDANDPPQELLISVIDDPVNHEWDVEPAYSRDDQGGCHCHCGYGHGDFDVTWGPFQQPENGGINITYRNACGNRGTVTCFVARSPQEEGKKALVSTDVEYCGFVRPRRIDLRSFINPSEEYYLRVTCEGQSISAIEVRPGHAMFEIKRILRPYRDKVERFLAYARKFDMLIQRKLRHED
jgi:hypothetical protein